MAARLVSVDRDTPLLLPPSLRDWVPADHLVHFILDAVDALDLRQVQINTRGTGSEQYPPAMLLGLLIYSYATGTFSSRRIEQSTYDSVPVRLLTADTHPDHDTLCTFRRENKDLLTESFVRVLQLAQQLKLLQFGQLTVAADGTKVLAHASKHSAVSYQRAEEMIEQLEAEVKQLLAKAEQADATPLHDGLSIPEEITRRQERKAALAGARKERGEKLGGKPPKAPTPEPDAKDQHNFTDPESRIMKAGNGQHFEQSYNAQAAVEVQSRLIVGQRVSQAPNDKQELAPTLASIPASAGLVAVALVDSGFYSEAAVQQVEAPADGKASGPTVYAAVEKTGHHRSVNDLEVKPEPEPPAVGASMTDVMRHRLQTSAGKTLYKLRQQTIEPVFGIIKSVLGFRQFRLRGREKVSLEWTLVCLAYNLKRLHRLGAGLKLGATN
jgi:transposase